MQNFKINSFKTWTIVIALWLLSLAALAQTNQASFKGYSIDTTLNTKLEKAKLKLEFNLPMLADGFWYFMDKKNFKALISKREDPVIFFDTLQTLTEVVCDCMMKNDTIYLRGGIAYTGGFGFELKIVNNSFNSKIWLAGKGYRTSNTSEFVDEIFLNTINQVLKIQSQDSLRIEKRMVGELILETEDYFEKGERGFNKVYMKLLFGCKLDDAIIL